MSDEWGPWVDGTIAPINGAVIQMEAVDAKGRRRRHECTVIRVYADGLVHVYPAMPETVGEWVLDRYRIRKPRALLQLIEMVENLPDRVKEDA